MKKSFPIAIVGMSFRFPGNLQNEQIFWRALRDGHDVVTQIGLDRWASDLLQHRRQAEPGRSITFSAGVLSRIDEFDASFFGISPREASKLDPQQRLLLELAWEAMENAGQPPDQIAGSNCAVFVGISGLDYGMRTLDDLSAMDAYSMTGNTLSIAANRLSYVFDLRGPSMAVDTACSSSLVALHQACCSLRSGEASRALVGGVNLLLHPYPFVGFTKASMLSADGRCKAFDASGNGYVRAEGAAVLLLKPLAQAEADGDPIHAVILGSAINADGARKTGITIPSIDGQTELLERVLRQSKVSPGDVDYIEAHGTGTAVGDPVEAGAIGRVFGRNRPKDQRLPIGSVKTNLGHLEPASGMAGLIKTILALKNRALPPSLHFENPNPNIDFTGLNLEVVTQYRPLRKRRRPLIMGVNSFGFGGANAHVLLREYKPRLGVKQAGKIIPPLFLSARSSPALREMAARMAEQIEGTPSENFYNLAHTAAYRRQHLEKRLAVWAAAPAEIARILTAYAENGSATGAVEEDALAEPAGIAFVYSGNGAQWIGMGRRLLEESQPFAATLGELDKLIQEAAGFSILTELAAESGHSHLNDTTVAQPLLFAIQVALTRLLAGLGITPDATAGHSVGEVAAAWAAGILTLEQAVQVICVRSHEQGKTRGAGRMAAIGLSPEAMTEFSAADGMSGIVIAGINSPGNVTVSGSLAELEILGERLTARGVFFRMLDLDYAFHSHHMEPIRQSLQDRLEGLRPSQGKVTFVSTVVGGEVQGAALVNEYWWRNVREPVRFDQAMAAMVEKGCRIFLEIGPHAILQRYMAECLSSSMTKGRMFATARKNEESLSRLTEVALHIQLSLLQPRLDAYFPEAGGFVSLPNYPWQREHFWHKSTSEGYRLIERNRVHPLLGYRLKDADASWENVLDTQILPYLADHSVAGAVVFPGAAYVEMALAAAREWFGGDSFEIEELDIISPIVFEAEHSRSLRFNLLPRDGSFSISSRSRLSEDDWTVNAVGRLLGAPTIERAKPARQSASSDQEITIDRAGLYGLAAILGLEYGPLFQGIETVRVKGSELHATLNLSEAIATANDHFLHPAVLDLAFQSLIAVFSTDIEAGKGLPLLPIKVGKLSYFGGDVVSELRGRLLKNSGRSVVAEFELYDAKGRIVATASACRFRAAVLKHADHRRPALWKISPVLRPHPRDVLDVSLAPLAELIQEAKESLLALEPQLRRNEYFHELAPLMEALVVSFAYDAFRELNSKKFDWLQQALGNALVLDETRRSLFLWIAEILGREGYLREENGSWLLDEISPPPPAEAIWREILAESSASLPELLFIGRVGRRLPALLSGEQDPVAMANVMATSPLTDLLYDASPSYIGTNEALRTVLRRVATDWPSTRRLRILEIARGGDMVRSLMPDLPADRCDYVLAEAEGDTLDRLSAEYEGHPFVHVAGLDAATLQLKSNSPIPEHFDVVVLHHWLHRQRNPSSALNGLRNKLAAGGLLVLSERYPDMAADLHFGIDPSWWHEDEGRPVSSLLFSEEWAGLLTQNGYSGAHIVREPAGEDVRGGAYLILAQNPELKKLPMESAPSVWLLLAEQNGTSRTLAKRIAARLSGQGKHVVLAAACENVCDGICFDPNDMENFAKLFDVAQTQYGAIDHIVNMIGFSDAEESQSCDPLHIAERRCTSTLKLVQALETAELVPRIWLVTSGGALAEGAEIAATVQPDQAPLWGFGRVLMNEHQQFNTTLIDLRIDLEKAGTAQRLLNEFLAPDGENEIVLTENGRHALRMTAVQETNKVDDAPTRYSLNFSVQGQLRNLAWYPAIERELAPDEIEVRTAAAGLNFRDVMYAMGLLPDEALENGFSGPTLGLEFAGEVSRIGTGVSEFSIGDEVMGFGSACFSSHVVTKSSAVVRKPANWSFAEAATVPTVFFTVWYSLKHLAQIQPGERILIHGAAGGVGIAAIQLARYLGAEIFATAGSEEKRDFARLMGADHVLDSRSLAFADQILELTAGEGVDVVLNSLAGEAIRRNLNVLKPFGRFLELGKRDFFENTAIGLRPFKDNISYFGIDADQLFVARPELAQRLFREMMDLFEEGALRPLPHRVFSADHVVDAFRTMQQARQIGKVVVSLEEAPASIATSLARTLPPQLSREATYLVTGGIGGFGLESACWLAKLGAGHLVLLGRRGMDTPGSEAAIRQIEALGAKAHVYACDVTDRASLAAVLERIHKELPPLRGTLHAAMVLDDALIHNLDGARMHTVLAPKISGGWNLHELTLDLPLDFFILYSSATTAIGNPGQANYVAGNAFLESLAAMRLSRGLPATCLGWGAIGDVGYLARHEEVKDSLTARLGGEPLSSAQALERLGEMLADNRSGLAVLDFDWRSLARFLPSVHGPRFETMRTGPAQLSSGQDSEDIRSMIAGCDPQEAARIVQDKLAQEIALILCLPVERVDRARSLYDLGMDSLMAVELALSIEKRFGVNLPVMAFNEGPTIERIGSKIVGYLSFGDNQLAAIDDQENHVRTLAAQHAHAATEEEIVQITQELRSSYGSR